MNRKLLNIFISILTAFFFVIIFKKYKKKSVKLEKVLYVEQADIPVSLDPQFIDDLVSMKEVAKVYEGLYEYSYLKTPTEVIPNLADILPKISSDGKVYTISIKKGVKFQDNKCFPNGEGREMTAEDVRYSFLRFADPKTRSRSYSFVEGRILGLDQWRTRAIELGQANYKEVVPGIVVLDRYTIQFNLTDRWPQLLNIFTMPFSFVVPYEAVDYYGEEFSIYPVGTGPFIIEKFNSQEGKIIAYKNKNFREKFFPVDISADAAQMVAYAGKRLPFLDRIETSIIKEEQPRWFNFLSKKLDIVNLNEMTDISSKIDVDKPVQELEKRGVKLAKVPSVSTYMYALNNTIEPFKSNVFLRRAISLAYDRLKAINLFFDGHAFIADSIIPITLPGYDKNYTNPYNNCDLQKAKELMVQAGYPNGNGLAPLILDIKSDTRERQMAEFFKKCMHNIGIEVVISVNSWSGLLDKIHSGKSHIWPIHWKADYPDAENFLVLLCNGDVSYSGFHDENYISLFNKAKFMLDSYERIELYDKLNKIAAEQVPCIFTCHVEFMYLYHPWVLNFVLSHFKTWDYFQYIDIDLSKRA